MRNMLAFVAAVVLTVAVVGWYLDWYQIGVAPGTAGHRNVTVDINTVKIGDDVHKASDGVQHKLAERNKQPASSEPAKVVVPEVVKPAPVEVPVGTSYSNPFRQR